jgi:hypothetical protein
VSFPSFPSPSSFSNEDYCVSHYSIENCHASEESKEGFQKLYTQQQKKQQQKEVASSQKKQRADNQKTKKETKIFFFFFSFGRGTTGRRPTQSSNEN